MSEDQQFKIYTQVFQRVKNDAAHFRMLLDSGIQGEEFINVSAYVTEHYPNLNIEIRQLMFAWGGMIRSVLLDWFRRGMQENVSDMARFCTELSGDICARINAINPNFMLETERETVK